MEKDKDEVYILSLCKRFLPKLSVTRINLINVTSSFVIDFYWYYMKGLLNTNPLFPAGNIEDFVENRPPAMDIEFFLFVLFGDLLNKLDVQYFTICDFYCPSSRTLTTMKVSLNLIFYVNESLPTVQLVVNDLFKRVEKASEKRKRRREMREELSEATYCNGVLAEKLEQLDKEYIVENLKTKDDNVKNSEDVANYERQIDSFTNSISSQQCNIDNLKEEIKRMKDQIVFEEEYNNCKEKLWLLDIKITEYDKVISEHQQMLQELHIKMEIQNKKMKCFQNIDTSFLIRIKKFDSLTQGIESFEQMLQDICKKDELLEAELQELYRLKPVLQKEIDQKKAALAERKENGQTVKKMIHTEKNHQRKLINLYHSLEKELTANKSLCGSMNVELEELDSTCKECYERLLQCQNGISTTFTEHIEGALKFF